MKNFKKIYIFLIVIFFAITISSVGCQSKKAPVPATKKQKGVNLNIMTTNKMIYYMVKDIVKERHFVDFMFKTEEDQWKYVYSEDSLSNISKKDLFLYSGASFEPWINDYIDELFKTRVSVVNASRGIKITDYSKNIKYKDTIIKENPYYWMNLDNYKTAFFNITSAIQDKDPQNRGIYDENFKQVLKKVDSYSKQLKEISQKFKEVTFIVEGDKLDYFLKYNNFNYIKVYNDSDKEIKNNIENEIKKVKKCIFMYSDDKDLKDNAELIKKYSMATTKIIIYDYNLTYDDIIGKNINSLKNCIVP